MALWVCGVQQHPTRIRLSEEWTRSLENWINNLAFGIASEVRPLIQFNNVPLWLTVIHCHIPLIGTLVEVGAQAHAAFPFWENIHTLWRWSLSLSLKNIINTNDDDGEWHVHGVGWGLSSLYFIPSSKKTKKKHKRRKRAKRL